MMLRANATRGLAVFFISTALASPAFAEGRTELLVRSGDVAPETEGARFQNLFAPSLNDAGDLAFRGQLVQGEAGVNSTNDTGIWRNDSLLARSGALAPGTGGGVFADFIDASSMNAAGSVAFRGTLQIGPGGTNQGNAVGIFRDGNLVLRTGGVAPNVSGAELLSLGLPAISDTGELAFFATMVPGVGSVTQLNDQGIWRGSNLISLVAREGDQAPGLATGAVFGSFANASMNSSGQVAFRSLLRPGSGGVTSANDATIWQSNTLIAREGQQVGGTSAGTLFSSFGDPAINDSGQIAYRASLRGSDVRPLNNHGIFVDTQLVVRRGDQPAGTPEGARFEELVNPAIGEGGQIYVGGLLEVGSGGAAPGNRLGLWAYGTDGDGLLVTRTGNTIDGRTVNGFVYNQRNSTNSFGQLAYRVIFTDGTEAIALFTPDLRWRPNVGGNWDSASNWTLGQAPGRVHEVAVDPETSLTVAGPAGPVTVRSLAIGGGTGIGTLSLNGGPLTALEGVTIEASGRLTGTGLIDGGDVSNFGQVVGDNVVIGAALVNEAGGVLRGRAGSDDRIGAAAGILNRSGGLVDVRAGEGLTLDGLVENAGELRAVGGRFESRGALVNTGTGSINARNASLDFAGGLTNLGRVQLSLGTSDIFGDVDNAAEGQIIQSGGGNVTFWDDMKNNGEIRISAGGQAVLFGDLFGTGSFTGPGTVFLEGGTFSPGSSPGIMSFGGDFDMSAAGGSSIFIGGLERGTEHSGADVAGALTLGGLLSVELAGGFLPGDGSVFELFRAGSILGDFAGFQLPDLGGAEWEVLRTDTRFSLAVRGDGTPGPPGIGVIPLPAGGWLLVSAIGMLALIRRRRPA